MAKLYGEIAASALMTFDKSFSRSNGQPLDSTEVFYSYAAAEAYALTDVAYVSQKIAVVETVDEVTTVTHYGIEPDGSLKELGSTPVGDGLTVEVVNGKISLVGLDTATDTTKKYQPVLVNGKLTWQELSSVDVSAVRSDLDEVIATVGDAESGLVADVEANTDAIINLGETIGEVTEGKTVVEMIADAQTAATYDDTELAGRVKTIEDDYLNGADKTELVEAIATAKTEAIETILGETVDADFDTLQEVAAWIQSDTTNSTELINRVTAIENDYLKGADKITLQGEIDALEALVGTLPEGAVSETVIDYITEVVDGLKIGDYAKASDLTAATDRIKALEDVEAEKNVIATVDGTELVIDENRNLTIAEVAQDKISGLTNVAGDEITIADALSGKVDKVEGSRLLTEKEAAKLEKLVIDETTGEVGISGTISAENVVGLDDLLAGKVDVVEGMGLSANNFTNALLEKLNGIDEGAEVNVIEAITIDGTALEITDKTVAIPTATTEKSGLVKLSSEIGVNEETNALEVKSIDISKITQGENDVLILNGGTSKA